MKTVKCGDHDIKVFCSHTEIVLTDIIKGNPRNPNKHPKNQIELLGKIIKSQGWRAPITISKRSGMVVKGHGRLEAAKLIGCDHCPVDYQDYDTEADEIADLLADNKIAELASIDSELELSHKQFLIDDNFDLELAGFSFDDFDLDSDNKDKDDDIDIEEDVRLEVINLSESQQEDLYNELSGRGFECRVLKL